ncbi:MAG: SurA N-terminal domain-containing protein, partial [bacterium]
MSIISRIKEVVFPGNKGAKSVVYGLLAGLLAVFILALIVIGVGIYRYNWQGAFIQKTVKIFPYPAARVNWHFLSYADYLEEVNVLTNFYAKQAAETGSPAVPNEEIRKRVMDRQIRNEFFQQLAKKDDLKITDVDVEVAWQSMIKSGGSTEAQISQMVQDLYGWAPAVFKQKIIQPSLTEEKVRE